MTGNMQHLLISLVTYAIVSFFVQKVTHYNLTLFHVPDSQHTSSEKYVSVSSLCAQVASVAFFLHLFPMNEERCPKLKGAKDKIW